MSPIGSSRTPAGRSALVRACLGAVVGCALLSRPVRAARWAAGRGSRPPAVLIMVLGAREVVQSAVLLLHPTRRVATTALAVDLLHGASMAALAVLMPAYRPAVMVSAAEASLGAALLIPAARGWSR